MTFRPGSDLITLLRTLDMTNVTALTNRPIIRLAGLDDTAGDAESGELIIEKETYRPIPLTLILRHQRAVLPATYTYAGSSETTFKEVVEEIDRLLRVENKSTTRAYIYEMEYDWDTNVDEPVVNLTFTLTKKYVVISS